MPTPELQPQAQALCRLGNATTELHPIDPGACLEEKIRVSVVCMNVCICVVTYVSMWRPEVDIGHLS